MTTVLSNAAQAANAPRELYGKSVSLSWTERRELKYVDGQEKSYVVQKVRTVYISDKGRYFVGADATTFGKKGRVGWNSKSGAKMFAPDQNDMSTPNMRGWIMKPTFEGRSLILYEPHRSGADRTEVAFDQSFQTCSIKHVFGKEAGAPGEVMRGITGRLQMLVSAETSGDTCSVSQGNLLAH
jgi:hypothetical protein